MVPSGLSGENTRLRAVVRLDEAVGVQLWTGTTLEVWVPVAFNVSADQNGVAAEFVLMKAAVVVPLGQTPRFCRLGFTR